MSLGASGGGLALHVGDATSEWRLRVAASVATCQDAGMRYASPESRTSGLPFGIAGIVLSAIGIGLAWIPGWWGILGVAVGIAGLVLGLHTLVRTDTPALGVAGVVVSVLAIIISIALLFVSVAPPPDDEHAAVDGTTSHDATNDATNDATKTPKPTVTKTVTAMATYTPTPKPTATPTPAPTPTATPTLPPKIPVPDVVGMDAVTAISAVEKAGFIALLDSGSVTITDPKLWKVVYQYPVKSAVPQAVVTLVVTKPGEPEPTPEPEPVTPSGLTVTTAQAFCTEVGHALYPKGFEPNLDTNYLERRVVFDAWFISFPAQLTNADGKQRQTWIECTVSGTETEPHLDGFYYY